MAGPIYQDNANYTLISTIGTQTVDAGPPATDPGVAGRFGVLYGYNAVSAGTAAMVLTYYDIVVSQGTTTTTNTLLAGTASTAGATIAPASGVGIRYRGSLVVVTSGTAGAGNTLWD